MVPRPLSVTARKPSCFKESFRSTVRSSKNSQSVFRETPDDVGRQQMVAPPAAGDAGTAERLLGLVVGAIFVAVAGTAVTLGHVLEPPLPDPGGSSLREDAK